MKTIGIAAAFALALAVGLAAPVSAEDRDPSCTYGDILAFTEPGTKALRVEIVPKWFFRRYAKTKVRVLLGETLDPERPYHTSVDGVKVVTLVR